MIKRPVRPPTGFTLIELLIVIGIIGVLVAISLFGLQGARESARDAKRKNDLETIRSALELYRSDCGGYPAVLPTGGSSLKGDGSSTSCSSSNVYVTAVPQDPQDPARGYTYTSSSKSVYTLCTSLEQAPEPAQDVTGCGSCGEVCNYKTTQF